jgi:ubiquinone/menaquinone biosynthesis C-methylase UbiE
MLACAAEILHYDAMSTTWNYEQNAADYGNFAKISYSWEHIERPGFNNLLAGLALSDMRILDLGSGSGRIVDYLTQMGAQADAITGIEPSLEIIKLAQQANPKSTFVNGKAEALPFAPESFDLITANMMLHNIDGDDIPAVFEQIHSTLRPGGSFIFVEPMPDETDSIGQWAESYAPWDATIRTFKHDFKKIFNTIAPACGLEIAQASLLPILDDGTADPVQFRKYTSGHYRAGVRLQKSF